MPQYDKLERLDRLRQSGALTQEEFDLEKQALLARGGQRVGRNIAIGVALVFVVVAAVLLGRSIIGKDVRAIEQDAGNSAVAVLDQNAVATNTVADEPVVQAAAAMPGATLDWAFSDQVIGLNPVFVEGKLGPARSKSAGQWEFDVKGCTVSYAVTAHEIVSATTAVKAGCLPSVNGRTITQQTTFAQLGGSTGSIRASCLYNCGNAYDPTIDLYQSGFHANNFIDAVYQSNLGDPQADATDMWIKSIRAAHGHGPEDYDGDDHEWFQCTASPPASVVAALGPERVGSVTIGRNLDRDGNCRYRS